MKHLELASLRRLRSNFGSIIVAASKDNAEDLLREICDTLQINAVKIEQIQNEVTLVFRTFDEVNTLLETLGSKPLTEAHKQFDRQYGSKISDIKARGKVISITLTEVETSSVWSDVALKQGDRVIVNVGTSINPVCHTGTVVMLYPIRKRVEVMLDNGDRQEHSVSNRATGVIGFIKGKRSKQSSIDARELDKWLDLDRWCASNLFDSSKKGITL